MKLYIPEIGNQLRLTVDWTFDLYNEYRNATLLEKIGDSRDAGWYQRNIGGSPCTIPAGAVLKVDRIYIRKGISEYSSITFCWVGERTEPKVEKHTETHYDSFGKPSLVPYIHKIPRKPVRFWAKLDDVNNIEFEKIK